MNAVYTEYDPKTCLWHVLYGCYDSNGFWGTKIRARLPVKPTARQQRILRKNYLNHWSYHRE